MITYYPISVWTCRSDKVADKKGKQYVWVKYGIYTDTKEPAEMYLSVPVVDMIQEQREERNQLKQMNENLKHNLKLATREHADQLKKNYMGPVLKENRELRQRIDELSKVTSHKYQLRRAEKAEAELAIAKEALEEINIEIQRVAGLTNVPQVELERLKEALGGNH